MHIFKTYQDSFDCLLESSKTQYRHQSYLDHIIQKYGFRKKQIMHENTFKNHNFTLTYTLSC